MAISSLSNSSKGSASKNGTPGKASGSTATMPAKITTSSVGAAKTSVGAK